MTFDGTNPDDEFLGLADDRGHGPLALQGRGQTWRVVQLTPAPRVQLLPRSSWLPHREAIAQRARLLEAAGTGA